MVDLALLNPETTDADLTRTYPDARDLARPDPYAPEDGTPPRRGSYLAFLTLTVAVLAGGVMFAVSDGRPDFDRIQAVIAGALAVVGVGLVFGAWFGRDRKLTTLGAIMSLALALTSVGGDPGVAGKLNRVMWRPAAVTQADQTHKVIIGESIVDLTSTPLAAGQRYQVNAEVMVGVLDVRVPSTARVELDGHALIGDITVDHQVTGGPGARVNQVLEPEGKTHHVPPTIVLRIRSKIGDMEVTRVPA